MKKYSIALTLTIMGFLTFYCNEKQATEEQAESIPNYKIAYNVLFDEASDNYEIFVMDMDGKNKKNISNWKGVDWVYYSYGDKIYFLSDRDSTYRVYALYEMDADGNNIRKVSDYRLRDSWFGSRKGNAEFIINPHSSVDSVFYIINMNGELISTLHTGMSSASDPIFTADGNHVIFRGGTKKSKRDTGYKEELYKINVDGTGLMRLTQYPEQDTTAGQFGYKAGPPRWNPKDNFISYQSKQNGKYSLYGVSPDGQKQWKLTTNKQEEGWHAWSPDGNYLAIELFDPIQTAFHIGLMDTRTDSLQILTDTTYTYQQAPVFVENKTGR